MQPITVTPAQLAQGSYDLPSLQQGGNTVYDINSESIAALDVNGDPYPTYQIVSKIRLISLLQSRSQARDTIKCTFLAE